MKFISEKLSLYNYVNEKLTLNKQSKVSDENYKDQLESIGKKYLEPCVQAYNNKDKKACQSLGKDYYYKFTDIINKFETSNIKVSTKWWCAFNKYGSLSNTHAEFKPHYRKNEENIFNTYGVRINLFFKNIDTNLFKTLGYSDRIEITISMDLLKTGETEIYINRREGKAPKDWVDDIRKLLGYFNELGFNFNTDTDNVNKYWLGEKNSTDKIGFQDFFNSLSTRDDFTAHSSEDGIPRLINKIEKTVKSIDPNGKLEWINKDGDDGWNRGGWYAFTSKFELTINNKTYHMKFYWSGDYDHVKSTITINDNEVLKLTYTTIHWDAGCSSNKHDLKIAKNIDDIFK